MTDMRVKMVLDLVNRLSPGAKEAARDIKGVKDAAAGLKPARVGDQLAAGLNKVQPAARGAGRDLKGVKDAARGMSHEAGPGRLAGSLERARAAASRLTAALRGAKAAQTDFQRSSPLADLSIGRKRGGQTVEKRPSAALAFPGIRSTVGTYIGARAGTDSVKKHAEAERAITRIGVTADASKADLEEVGATAFRVAQEVAVPYAKVVQGLETLVAQGRSLKDAMAFLPAVARTASAAGAEVDDIARTADSVSANFKIAADQMQSAFDIMAAGGKAGQFELKDMARYLPSLGPAAAAAGLSGAKGLTELVSVLQVMRKGSGTAEEAVSSLTNIFQKMESEETAKRFKKFGVDLSKGMDDGRKAGHSLLDVFEDLTATALKGDLSKIPKLFQDQEFARGVRALMTFRGERQRLAKSISSTAAGSVVTDLDKVTDNVQARLDQLANSYEKRMRQIGAFIAKILLPIDKKIDEITSGKNATLNKVNEGAQYQNADTIAREELKSGVKRPYDAETRQLVDARKEFLARQVVDDKIAKLDADIAGKEKILSGRPVRSARLATEGQLDKLKEERAAILGIQKAQDEANLSLAENEATRKRLKTRMSGLPDDKPGPITPGLSTFGFGPEGQSTIKPPLPLPFSPTYRTRDKPDGPAVVRPLPLPPARPDTLPKPPPMLKDLAEIYSVGPTATSASAEWVKSVRDSLDIDLGPAGMTMAEKLAGGLKSGTGVVTSAGQGVSDALQSAMSGTDLSSAGQRAAESFAEGIRRGAPAVAAAAQNLAAQAKSATIAVTVNSRVQSGRAISGALHDGVE